MTEHFLYNRTAHKVRLIKRVNIHDAEADHIKYVKELLHMYPKQDNVSYTFQLIDEGYEIFKETKQHNAGWLGTHETLNKESLCVVGLTSFQSDLSPAKCVEKTMPARVNNNDFSEVLKELSVYLANMNARKQNKIPVAPPLLPVAPSLTRRRLSIPAAKKFCWAPSPPTTSPSLPPLPALEVDPLTAVETDDESLDELSPPCCPPPSPPSVCEL